MPTRVKSDPESLLKRTLRILSTDLKNIENWQKQHKGQPLDYKQVTAVAGVVAKLQDILAKEEDVARKLLKEASRLPVAELVKRASGVVEPEVEEDEDEPEVLPDE